MPEHDSNGGASMSDVISSTMRAHRVGDSPRNTSVTCRRLGSIHFNNRPSGSIPSRGAAADPNRAAHHVVQIDGGEQAHVYGSPAGGLFGEHQAKHIHRSLRRLNFTISRPPMKRNVRTCTCSWRATAMATVPTGLSGPAVGPRDSVTPMPTPTGAAPDAVGHRARHRPLTAPCSAMSASGTPRSSTFEALL
jgi:hypothetical protein